MCLLSKMSKSAFYRLKKKGERTSNVTSYLLSFMQNMDSLNQHNRVLTGILQKCGYCRYIHL